jgi:nucleoside-diphosphate-sugar epimerase
VLFIDDLVRAFRQAAEKIERTAGEVFNIGGGPGNTLSVWHELAAREPIPRSYMHPRGLASSGMLRRT